MRHSTYASEFFTAGGTLPLHSPSYVQRPADDQLFDLTQAGKFCYVLTARQMGKSSLMVRTARRLEKQQVTTAQIDLNDIESTVTADDWYLTLLNELEREFRLSVEAEEWWHKQTGLTPVQCFTDFLGKVALTEIKSPIVIFVDEIDTTLELHFTDDFFAAIRAMHNRRAIDPIYLRLTFILLGAATPVDLIKDHRRTPFNIGNRIDLREFSAADAQVLSRGLQEIYPEQGKAIFNRIFDWTNGHPYLTQKLCLSVAESDDDDWDTERVDELVDQLFLSAEARNESNLQSVQNSVKIVKDNRQRRRLLNIYRHVYRGKKIREDALSPEQNLLQLFGLVRAEQNTLQVRNEIYRRVFDLDWIKTNTPIDQMRRIWTRRIMVIAVLILLFLGSMALGAYTRWQREEQAQVYEKNFNQTIDPTLQLNYLVHQGLNKLSVVYSNEITG